LRSGGAASTCKQRRYPRAFGNIRWIRNRYRSGFYIDGFKDEAIHIPKVRKRACYNRARAQKFSDAFRRIVIHLARKLQTLLLPNLVQIGAVYHNEFSAVHQGRFQSADNIFRKLRGLLFVSAIAVPLLVRPIRTIIKKSGGRIAGVGGRGDQPWTNKPVSCRRRIECVT
jgi:hypothetical protein